MTNHPDMSERELALAALGPSMEAETVAWRLASRLRHDETFTISSPRTQRVRKTRVRFVAPAAVVAVALAANLVAVRLVPTYAQAISHAPLVSDLPRPLLQLAGLTEAQVSRVAVSATSSGHTITLLAASADSARTVLLVQLDGRDALPSKTAAGYQMDGNLTDQYGRTYERVGGQGGDLWFSPLSGAATHGPVELRLEVRSLEVWPFTPLGEAYPPVQSLHGDWVVGTTVTRRSGTAVPLPTLKTVGGATYTVTSIRISGTEVTIDWKLTGDSRTVTLFRAIKNHTWPPVNSDPRIIGLDNFLQASIVNSDGSAANVAGNSDNFGYGLPSEQLAEGTIQQVLPAAGGYLLRIGQVQGVEFSFKVP